MKLQHTSVSVVMPTLNQGGFIEQAIHSVLGEESAEVELVVCDGGSTDSTLSVLQRALARYGSRLRWVSERDSGPANAINKAVRLARGAIVGWLNSDDLLAPGAIKRAVHYFRDHPNMLMVYGEAEHIDLAGRSLGRYPTLPAPVTIDKFHSGCFICQPTVFVTREFFDRVGFLDEGLRTAFDFDLWVRCFREYPDRVGYFPALQAFSRLHDGAITVNQRRQVAIEGISVLARHVGPPEAHWFWTYLDELCASFPLAGTGPDLVTEVSGFLEQTGALFGLATRQRIRDTLANDARLKMSIPGVFASIYSDGWAGKSLEVRMRQSPRGRRLVLNCTHASPVGNPLNIRIRTSWSEEIEINVPARGPFEIQICPPPDAVGDRPLALVESMNTFVPANVQPQASDHRELAFLVNSIRWR